MYIYITFHIVNARIQALRWLHQILQSLIEKCCHQGTQLRDNAIIEILIDFKVLGTQPYLHYTSTPAWTRVAKSALCKTQVCYSGFVVNRVYQLIMSYQQIRAMYTTFDPTVIGCKDHHPHQEIWDTVLHDPAVAGWFHSCLSINQ